MSNDLWANESLDEFMARQRRRVNLSLCHRVNRVQRKLQTLRRHHTRAINGQWSLTIRGQQPAQIALDDAPRKSTQQVNEGDWES